MSEKDVPLLNFTELPPTPQLHLHTLPRTPLVLQFSYKVVASFNMRDIDRQPSYLFAPI